MTTLYDTDSNCIKLNALQEYSLYFNYITKTYVLIKNNCIANEWIFTHIYKLRCEQTIHKTSVQFNSSIGNMWSNFKITIVVSHNNIQECIELCHKSEALRNVNFNDMSAEVEQHNMMLWLNAFNDTGFIDTLRKIIIYGHPKNPNINSTETSV